MYQIDGYSEVQKFLLEVTDIQTKLIKQGERVDDLQYKGLRIIQNPDNFCFGCDAVELANFVEGGVRDHALEIGSGSGIISILIAAKLNMKVTAVEVQESVADTSIRSVKLNGLEDKIEVLNMAAQDIPKILAKGSRSVVVCNPPYRKVGSGEKQLRSSEAIARHEIMLSFHEVADLAAYLLPTGGRFFVIHQAQRLGEVMAELISRKLEPKVLQVLRPNDIKPPHLFMLKCIKDGATGLIINPERAVKTYGVD